MSRAAPRTDHTHVLLLRGINVGRANRVSNARLAAWAEAAGARDVSTHLASGNVLFRLPDADDGPDVPSCGPSGMPPSPTTARTCR